MKMSELETKMARAASGWVSVAMRETTCPLCTIMGDIETGKILLDTDQGQKQVECQCVYAHRLFYEVEKYGVRGDYLRATLKKLKPSPLSTLDSAKQAALIAKVQSDPDQGWAFFGPPGTGKSTISAALFKNAYKQELNKTTTGIISNFFRVSARQLCDEAHLMAMGKYDEGVEVMGKTRYSPTVTRAKIEAQFQKRKRPHVFIEELDKINMTEFRRDAVFDVLNAAHECKGQIVLNSNLSWADFEQTFGTAFSWRVAQACYVVDLSAGSITPPKLRL